MTDNTRLAALEAVAEAARELREAERNSDSARGHAALDDVDRALNLLDAPAQPPGETVTLAMWRNPVGGVLLSVAGTKDDHDAGRSWTRLGTVTLAVTP